MATIRNNPSGTWQVRWRDPNGKQTSRTFARKTDALKKRAEVETQLHRGEYIDVRQGRVTVAELSTTWIQNPGWSAATVERYQSILDNYVLPRWARTPINGMRRSDIQEWVNTLATQTPKGRIDGTLSPYSVRKIVGVLRGVIDVAIGDRLIREDPSDRLQLPRLTPADRMYLTPSEVELLADAAGPERDAILLLAYTGLRFGEFAGLKVGDIDFRSRRIHIQRQASYNAGGVHWSPPKGGKSRRVLLPEFLAPLLRARIEDLPKSALVFPDSNGNPLRNRNYRERVFKPAAMAAGLVGLTPHELRHTAASILISANASVLGVQRMLGHAKPSTTLDHYSDLFESDLDRLDSHLTEARQSALRD